jgi:toxin ParE1/3/4
MAHKVIFHPHVQRELVELHDYIAEHGSPTRAVNFVLQIRAFCLGLSDFPQRGSVRDDIAPGVRVVGFRRRVSIVFTIDGENVWILGIFYGGRDIRLGPPDEEE